MPLDWAGSRPAAALPFRCDQLIALQDPELSYRHPAVDAVVLPRDESSIVT
jgi:hypothetical protein